MSETAAMITVVIAVVLVVATVGLLMVRTRGRERRTHQAHELRTAAFDQTGDIEQARRRADGYEATAEHAREQADIAEREARVARRELAQAEAHQEDTVREADRLDPSVDHRSEGYAPEEVRPPGLS